MIQLLRIDGSQKCVHLQLGSEYLAGQTVACGNGRMNGAEYADLLAVDQHLGTAARVIGRVGLLGSEGRALDIQLTQQRLDGTLELEERQAAVAAEGQDLLLVRQNVRVSLAVLDGRGVDGAQLVQRSGRVAVCVVVRQIIQHGRQHGGAHHAEILTKRVEDGGGDTARVVLVPADHVVELRGDERMAHGLVKACLAANQSGSALRLLGRRELTLYHLACVQRGRDLVVAVHAGNLLSHVAHAVDVGAEERHNNLVILDLEVQLLEQLYLLLSGQLQTEQGIHLVRLERQTLMVRVGVVNVDNAVDDLACAQLLHQLARTVDRIEGHARVKALLKAAGGLGTHAERLCGDTNGSAVEVCGLENDGLGVVHNLGVCAAHNTRNSNRLVVVADGEHFITQIVIHAVQSLDGLTVAGTADNNAAIGQALVVERMHRLAVLEHNIVGDINDVVDRTNAAGVQTLAHPRRRRLDLDILDNAGGVARAQVGVLDLDGHILVDVVANALYFRGLDAERTVEGSRSLAGQTDHAQAVRAVGRNLKIGNPVVQTEHLLDVLANRGAGRQEQDAVLARIRYAAVGQTQLLERAHHAVGRHAAQLALGDLHAARQGGLVQADRADLANGRRRYIGCAGDDLHRLLLADIELADLQMVGIRVIDNLEDLAGHNVVDLRAEVVNLLDLGAGHSQLGIILLRGDAVHIGIIRKPR